MSDNGTDVKAILREFIKNNILYSTDIKNIKDNTSFLETGILDSTGVLELIDFIEERFHIKIGDNEVIPDNLDSFDKIDKFIRSKL